MQNNKPEITPQIIQEKYNSGQREFTGLNLEYALFEDLNLEDANFEGSWFHSSTFKNCNLKNANLSCCNLKCVEFINVNLNGVSFEGSSVDASTYENCDLRNANFTDAGWYGANLPRINSWKASGRITVLNIEKYIDDISLCIFLFHGL